MGGTVGPNESPDRQGASHAVPVQGGLGPLQDDVDQLGRQLTALRSEDQTGDEALTQAVAALETAYEELRVASEELWTQQSQLTDLLGQFTSERNLRERFTAALPLPVLTTTSTGVIRTANPAACALLLATHSYLLGKPVASIVELADRRDLRTMVTAALRTGRDQTGTVRLRPRVAPAGVNGGGQEPRVVLADVLLLPEEGPGDPFIRWLLVPATPGGAAATGTDTAGALMRIVKDASTSADLHDALRRAVRVIAGSLGGNVAVSVTLGTPLEPQLQTWDGPAAQAWDAAQLGSGEGPCVEASLGARQVSTADATTDPRWPRLAGRIGATALPAVLSTPLVVEGEVVGVLNLYSPGQWLPRAAPDAELYAGALAALVHDARRRHALEELTGQLQRALSSRAVIDQAIGVLMTRLKIDPDAAFRELVRVSQHENVKVRELAGLIVNAAQRGLDPSVQSPLDRSH